MKPSARTERRDNGRLLSRDRTLRPGRLLLLLAVVLGLGLMHPAQAQPPAKASSDLIALHDAYCAARRSGRAFQYDDPTVRVVSDRVVIDAVAAADGEALKNDLVALGMRAPAAFGRVVSGELPIAAIPALQGLDSLAFARPAIAASRPEPGTRPGMP